MIFTALKSFRYYGIALKSLEFEGLLTKFWLIFPNLEGLFK
jgi:hypothetical protein